MSLFSKDDIGKERKKTERFSDRHDEPALKIYSLILTISEETTMSYYSDQVAFLNDTVFPNKSLIEQVKAAKRFMDAHFSENITIDHIACSAFYSKFHFIRAFKTCYGQTPHQYVKTVRIQQAKLLLKNGANVCDACYAVGFKSTTAFSGLFKRMTGYSPSSVMKK
jgi:AraC-like DNA-binding protein